MNLHHLVGLADTHLAASIIAAVAAVAAVVVAVVAARSGARMIRARGVSGEQLLTLTVAALATAVSAQGMWVFFDKSLHLPIPLRIMVFAFLELTVLASALRARSAQLRGGSAGVDGIAMWVLTGLSSVLAATDAPNTGALFARLAIPLVAAWGWERSMKLERELKTGWAKTINWRLTPERVLIRLGLADPTDRTASEVAVTHRMMQVALAADEAAALREAGITGRRVRRADAKVRATMRRALSDGGLRPDELRENIAMLRGAVTLRRIEPANFHATPLPLPPVDTDAAPAAVIVDNPVRDDARISTGEIERIVDEYVDRMRTPAASPAARVGDAGDEIARTLKLVTTTTTQTQMVEWREIAEKIAGRRDPAVVAEILRMRYEDKLEPATIVEETSHGRDTVYRVLRRAEESGLPELDAEAETVDAVTVDTTA